MVCNALPYFTHSDGYKYVDTFPKVWLENEDPACGPVNCTNCRTYGSINGIFVGYCLNCVCNNFKGTRGNGFYGENRQYKIEGGQFYNPETNSIETKFEITDEIDDIGNWNFYLIEYQEQVLNELDFEYQNMLMGIYPPQKNTDDSDKAVSMASSSSNTMVYSDGPPNFEDADSDKDDFSMVSSTSYTLSNSIVAPIVSPNFEDADSDNTYNYNIFNSRHEYSPAISPICSSCESSPRSSASISIGN